MTGNVEINGSLMVTGSVNTAQIASSAVTLHPESFTAGLVNVSAPSTSYGSYVDIQTVTYTSSGSPVFIFFYTDGDESTNLPGEFQMRLILDGVEQAVFTPKSMEGDGIRVGAFSFNFPITPSAGSRTVKVQIRGRQLGGGSSNGQFTNRSLLLLEMKR